MSRALLTLTLALTAACRPPTDPAALTDATTAAAAADAGPALDAGDDAAGVVASDLAGAPEPCQATDPRAVAPTVDPTPEAGEQPYLDTLTPAQSSIRVAVYLMGQGAVLDTLKAKAAAGLDVKVLLDQSQRDVNQKYADQLAAAGAQVQWSDPQFSYMHAKFILVDGMQALISTGNFSRDYSILLERNFVVRLADPADVADLVALFDADWARTAPDLSCTRLVVSPVNARDRIVDLIASAQTTLTIESMQLADSDVRAAIAARAQAGVAIRALIAQPSWVSANTDAAAFLHGLGIEVRTIPHLHTKALVADGARAYLGSENLSYTSLHKNREVGLVTTEPSAVAPVASTFDKDWAVATAL